MSNDLPSALSSFTPPTHTESLVDAYSDPRTFCRLRFSPMLATGVILGVIREHYGNPTAIVDPLLQKYVWRSDDRTGIMIETSTNDSLSRIEMKPAILVRRNAIQVSRVGINDEVLSGGGEIGKNYAVELRGSHTVFCVSSKPGHSECLANETAIYLMQSANLIARSLCFNADFRLSEIGALGSVEGSGGLYVVPATFEYATDFGWSVAPDKPVLRYIDTQMLLYPDEPLQRKT